MTVIDAVESAWEDCKKALVIAAVKDDAAAPPLEVEGEDALRAHIEVLTAKNEMITAALVAMITAHHDAALATLVGALIRG